MRIRMRVDVSGTRNGQEWPRRGSVVELPDDEARQYCQAGMAEPVATFTEAETATLTNAETRATAPVDPMENRVVVGPDSAHPQTGAPAGLTTTVGPVRRPTRSRTKST